MKARYNVVFVGKTGVGKSALINYLYGGKIRKTGVGKPITQRIFHCVDFEINGLPVRLFDSWGLEVGREQEWLGLLNKELERHVAGKHAEQWFHSVFYCIGAGRLKVEDFDTQIIKRFIRKKYKVTVILTKADLISEEDEEKLRDTVQNDLGQAVPVIPVCSEEKQLRGGRISEKFGKEKVELQAYNDFCDSIILRLPKVRYNVVFVGKTGVGKSALINYLYGDKIRETGVGKPVTQKGFHYADDEIDGLPVRFFDSWGLEVGKEGEWLGLLNEELKKRDTGKPAEQWFHSVFYCIAGSGHRVEDSDIKIIKRFTDDKYNVTVILTKADSISEDDEKELIDTIQNNMGQAISVIPVCSVEKIRRDGTKSKKFGKKDVELQAYNDFCDSIILRLPEHCVKVLEQRIDKWRGKQKKYIEKNTGRWNFDEIHQKIEGEAKSFISNEFEERNTIKQELKHTLELYGTFGQHLNYPPPETSLIMSLPTEEPNNTEWWEVPLVSIALLVTAGPILLGIRHLIWGAENNKENLLEYIENFVFRIKQRLPEIEPEIKKALEKLKKIRTV